MLFKQLTAYNIEMPKDEKGAQILLSAKQWRAYIFKQAMGHAFVPLTEHQQKGSGWEAPMQDINQEYMITAPQQDIHLLCYRTDERKIPTSAINEQLRRQVEKIEREEKRKVSKLEKATFKDEIIAQKIPHTLPTPSRVLVVFDLEKKTVLIGTSSEGAASGIRAAINEQLLPEYEVEEEKVKARLLPPVYCRSEARDHMTNWLRCDNDQMPANITLSDSVVLQRDKSKNISITGQSMDSHHVQEPLNDGYRAFSVPVAVLSNDVVMGVITLDKYGSFNRIDIDNEFKPVIDKDDEDAAWNQLFTDLVSTTLNFHYVKSVVMTAFGTESEGEKDTVMGAIENFHAKLNELGVCLLGTAGESESDSLYEAAAEHVIENRAVSISSIQRKLRIGYNRAARLVDLLERNGVVSAPDKMGCRLLIDSAA